MKADEYINCTLSEDFDQRISSHDFKSSVVRDAALTFKDSVAQISNLQSMPALVAGAMYELSESWAIACEQITGKRFWPEERWSERDVYERIMEAHQRIHAAKKEERLQLMDSRPFYDALHLLHIEHMNPEIPLASGFEAVAKSMFIYSWSAFEVLAESLFRAAIRKDPKGRFSIVNNIRENYEEHFPRPRGDKIIDSINSEEINAIVHLRNLIVHKSGVIDQKFLDNTDPLKSLTEVRVLGLNTKISFTYKLVTSFIHAFLDKSCDIIDAVDAWNDSDCESK